MTRGTKVAVTLAIALVGFAVLLGNTQARSGVAKIESRVVADTANGQKASFVIYLRDQANLSRAYGMKNQDARGWYVYRTLKSEAERTQAPITALLTSRGVSYRSFWVANVIMATGDRSVVDALAARSDVHSIESNDKSNWLQDTVAAPNVKAPGTIEPGITQVHAPDVWALGYTGQGIVVANQDTGMRWTHNALKPHYRGWTERSPTTTTTGTTPSTRAVGRARPTISSPATTADTARTRPVRRWVMTARATRSASPRARSGSAAGTWTRGTERLRPTPSASSSSSLLPT